MQYFTKKVLHWFYGLLRICVWRLTVEYTVLLASHFLKTSFQCIKDFWPNLTTEHLPFSEGLMWNLCRKLKILEEPFFWFFFLYIKGNIKCVSSLHFGRLSMLIRVKKAASSVSHRQSISFPQVLRERVNSPGPVKMLITCLFKL